MSLLVHICCGPCSGAVLERLLEEGRTPVGFFYNPNIQPLAEYLRRREGAAQMAEKLGVPIIFADALPEDEQRALIGQDPGGCFQIGLPTRPALPPAADPLPWLRLVAGKEHERCAPCIGLRLRVTALFAQSRGFAAFTSSLLYSRRQPHGIIAELGRAAAAEQQSLTFHYADWRPLWQRGIDLSKPWGVYRQPYCGCMFSEYDRYAGDLNRTVRAPVEKEA